MSSKYGNSPSFVRGYSGGRVRLDYSNSNYVHRGRGRGGSSSAASLSSPPQADADIKRGLNTSKIIDTIPAPPRPSTPEDIPIANVQYVASYNWVDSTAQPTIIVPGTSVFPSSRLEDITHNRRIPHSIQVRQLCGPGVKSRSSCRPMATPIS